MVLGGGSGFGYMTAMVTTIMKEFMILLKMKYRREIKTTHTSDFRVNSVLNTYTYHH